MLENTTDTILLDHTCKKHKVFNPDCKKCNWWKKHGLCNPKKHNKFDPTALYIYLIKYYVDERKYTPEQANEIAQKIVSEQIEFHKSKLNTSKAI
jgi:hypothetical protein